MQQTNTKKGVSNAFSSRKRDQKPTCKADSEHRRHPNFDERRIEVAPKRRLGCQALNQRPAPEKHKQKLFMFAIQHARRNIWNAALADERLNQAAVTSGGDAGEEQQKQHPAHCLPDCLLHMQDDRGEKPKR